MKWIIRDSGHRTQAADWSLPIRTRWARKLPWFVAREDLWTVKVNEKLRTEVSSCAAFGWRFQRIFQVWIMRVSMCTLYIGFFSSSQEIPKGERGYHWWPACSKNHEGITAANFTDVQSMVPDSSTIEHNGDHRSRFPEDDAHCFSNVHIPNDQASLATAQIIFLILLHVCFKCKVWFSFYDSTRIRAHCRFLQAVAIQSLCILSGSLLNMSFDLIAEIWSFRSRWMVLYKCSR